MCEPFGVLFRIFFYALFFCKKNTLCQNQTIREDLILDEADYAVDRKNFRQSKTSNPEVELFCTVLLMVFTKPQA